jgi:hypothetical protein
MRRKVSGFFEAHFAYSITAEVAGRLRFLNNGSHFIAHDAQVVIGFIRDNL